jgi:hypothetical protein
MTFDEELLRRMTCVPLVLWLTAWMKPDGDKDGV